ncbi:MAG: peptidoglycan DD-metalloendopeptidase family protein [Magnetospirillum sp.]|nr:peptidoglycan DD-metalloendopeptidase family protein [Magnetospirillum sp.]
MRRADRAALVAALLMAQGSPAFAQSPQSPGDPPPAASAQAPIPDSSPPSPADAAATGQRLNALERQLEKSQEQREEIRKKARDLADEMDHIRGDMVAAARAAQESEDVLSDLESQMADLKASEAEKAEALKRRSSQMTRVLTALQRLAWRPTEALIAQPQSPADTVRSAILLRAAVPQIEQSVKDLRGEIEALAQLRAEIGEQKRKITATTSRLEAEHQRLKDLYERKAQIQTAAQAETEVAEQRVDQLAAEAQDMRDLLRRLDEERQRRIAEAAAKVAAERAARKAAQEAEAAAQKAARDAEVAARKAEEEHQDRQTAQVAAAHQAELQAQVAAREKEIAAQNASRDAETAAREAAAGPLAMDKPFSLARGRLAFPARGKVVGRFGQASEIGHVAKGITIQTRRDAQVIAPYDGQVVFAGPFRGYGLLLIIEHGEGYHTLLAGMARIDVAVGQRLVAGEPVGVMGRDDVRPALYVELRHDGQPVNPLPWLSAQKSKVRG